jgi:hypothetical protein
MDEAGIGMYNLVHINEIVYDAQESEYGIRKSECDRRRQDRPSTMELARDVLVGRGRLGIGRKRPSYM